MLSLKDTTKEDGGNQWTLGKPESFTLDGVWCLCKANGLDCSGDVITDKDRCIDMDFTLRFMLGISIWKIIEVGFNENIIYVKNNTKNPYKYASSSALNVCVKGLSWLSTSSSLT